MVAFSGADPMGVLIGAKRASATLVHRLAVHPDHRRQGHGRHLLESLASKLAILGPPRLVAEIPETLPSASALFDACGYAEEAVLTDYVRESDTPVGAVPERPPRGDRLVIPVTVDDLAANGLLEAHPQVCWERAVETLTARKDEVSGLAVASDERIEACILYIRRGGGLEANAEGANAPTAEVVSLRSFIEDGGALLKQLLSRLGTGTFRFSKVHPAEMSKECLEGLGFRPAGGHRLYAAKARAG